MRKTLTFLAATTAITAGIGLPAWSAVRASMDQDSLPIAAAIGSEPRAMSLIFVSGNDDDDDEGERSRGSRTSDDDDEEDDDDYDDDDGDATCTGVGNPAPAGTMAPPQNGLFGNGAPPQAQVN